MSERISFQDRYEYFEEHKEALELSEDEKLFEDLLKRKAIYDEIEELVQEKTIYDEVYSAITYYNSAKDKYTLSFQMFYLAYKISKTRAKRLKFWKKLKEIKEQKQLKAAMDNCLQFECIQKLLKYKRKRDVKRIHELLKKL